MPRDPSICMITCIMPQMEPKAGVGELLNFLLHTHIAAPLAAATLSGYNWEHISSELCTYIYIYSYTWATPTNVCVQSPKLKIDTFNTCTATVNTNTLKKLCHWYLIYGTFIIYISLPDKDNMSVLNQGWIHDTCIDLVNSLKMTKDYQSI